MRFLLAIILLMQGLGSGNCCAQIQTDRPLWTTSRIKGTPEPPLPYVTRRILDDVEMKMPTEMVRVPGTDRWIVTQLNGSVLSFSKTGDPDQVQSLNLKEVSKGTFRTLGITFHPEFPKRPWVYIAYCDEMRSLKGAKLSRFRVSDPSVPIIDPTTETVFLNWNSTDHNGGNLQFGPDGFLYFPIGDGQHPNPPDPSNTGQDITDLQASILRIDVERGEGGRNYRIPPDNPFVKVPDARPEIWAFGVRNPWKMCFHPTTGELWTGDVGWEMREMVYRIDRGANYGWSTKEGSQIVKTTEPVNPIPITPPIVEHDHTEARSITGGFFWQHESLPELKDAYIYGDWMTGKIWGLKYDGEKVVWHEELVDTNLQIISFALDDNGEVLIVGYDGTIHKLVPNPDLANYDNSTVRFPTRLSETGIFASTKDQTPNPGVVEYSIIANHWADHTFSRQWIGLADDAKMAIYKKGDWTVGYEKGDIEYPHDTVFAKTVSIRTDESDPRSAIRLETQVLHRYHDTWNAYNYIWNEEQTDASLQGNSAIEKSLTIKDESQPDGIRKQTWLHASRDQCRLCHIWKAGTVHGFKFDQLNRPFKKANEDWSSTENQLDAINRWAMFEEPVEKPDPVVDLFDDSADLELRARHYLHLNCAHCHRKGGGGTSIFQLVKDLPLETTELIDEPAQQGDFGIPDAKVVTSGDPSRSVLLYRMMKSGRGHMPQFGTNLIDDKGVELVADWIASLKKGSTTPKQRPHEVESVEALSGEHLEAYFQDTSTALDLAVQFSKNVHSSGIRQEVATYAAKHPKQEIRELFERFLPFELRKKRLGNAIDVDLLLSTQGDIERGRTLYFDTELSCKTCHQIAGEGAYVGPDLSTIGTARKPREILESILNPSAKIEEKFQGKIVVTIDGEVISGLPIDGDSKNVNLTDATGKTFSIPMDDVEEQRVMPKSMMPEQLLSEMTLQEAADLLAFLNAQKDEAKVK